jgi:hypothetical protein
MGSMALPETRGSGLWGRIAWPLHAMRRLWSRLPGSAAGRLWAVLFGKAQPLISLLKSKLAVIQPLGRGVFASAVVALAVGIVLGWAELLLLAVALGAVLLAAIPFMIGRQSFEIKLDIPRLRVQVGASVFGELSVTNPAAKRQLPAELQLPIGRNQLSLSIPRLEPQGSWEKQFQVPTQRRAVIGLGPVRTSRGDSFGLLERRVQWTEPQELFVHPRTVAIEGAAAGFIVDLEGKPTNELSASDVSFHALRDYVVGDDLRHIHWKTVARVGKLMVRQFEQTRRSHLIVCLGMNPEEYASDDAFELAVSAAASLGVQAVREEHDLNIIVAGRELHRESPQRMLDDFSRLEFGASSPSIDKLARDAANTYPDASMAIIVVGAQADPATIHRAVLPFQIDTRVYVVRCEPGIEVTRRSISEAPVIAIGELDDLPRALRMVSG